MKQSDSSENVQLPPTFPVEHEHAARQSSLFDLPAYPGHDARIPPIYKSSPIVEALAGAIIGTGIGAIVAAMSDDPVNWLVATLVGAVVGALVGVAVASVTGPTGILTWRHLGGALIRVSLVATFGVLIGFLGILIFDSERDLS